MKDKTVTVEMVSFVMQSSLPVQPISIEDIEGQSLIFFFPLFFSFFPLSPFGQVHFQVFGLGFLQEVEPTGPWSLWLTDALSLEIPLFQS